MCARVGPPRPSGRSRTRRAPMTMAAPKRSRMRDCTAERNALHLNRTGSARPSTFHEGGSMTDTPGKIKFQPGSVVTTLGALQVATRDQIRSLLARHLSGDWGEVDREDAAANERALKSGERLMSVYDVNGEK